MAWRGEARARGVMRDVIHKPKMPVAVAVRATKYAVRTVVEPKVEWGQSCIFVPRAFLGVYSRERWIEPFHLYQSRITGNLPHARFRPAHLSLQGLHDRILLVTQTCSVLKQGPTLHVLKLLRIT
jgi:hypothetical protein